MSGVDPDANLREQERLLAEPPATTVQARQADYYRLRDLRHALGLWLALGGRPPDWAACPTAAAYYPQRPQRD